MAYDDAEDRFGLLGQRIPCVREGWQRPVMERHLGSYDAEEVDVRARRRRMDGLKGMPVKRGGQLYERNRQSVPI